MTFLFSELPSPSRNPLRPMVIQLLFKELLNTLFLLVVVVVVDIFDKMVNYYRLDSTINYEMKCKAERKKLKS